MSQHILEVTSVQPSLFVFTQQLTCNESEVSFEEFLLNFESKYSEQQQQCWNDYWTHHGYELVLEEFKLKYKNYLANTDESDADKEQKDSNDKIVPEEFVEDSEASKDESSSWQDIWEKHTAEIYSQQYSLFDSIYYNYFVDLKKSLRYKITTGHEEEEAKEEDLLSSQERITNELEQLELLGLPTQFGFKPSVSNSKRKRFPNRDCLWTQFSPFFSDDEEQVEDQTFEGKDIPQNNSKEISENLAMETGDEEKEKQLHALQTQSITKAKKKKNRRLRHIPDFILQDQSLLKYWRKRFSLFSRFDEGIRLDRESWFSVTPEKVAIHLAKRLACDTLIDGFCGSGGNAIQFAKTCHRVVAIDIDPHKVEMAKHNATIYGVADRIEFIVGDFFHFTERLQADVVFLSPPWGGPKYKKKQDYDVEKFLLPVGASELVKQARRISENIALFLPRNSNLQQIVKIAGIGKRCEVEHNYLDTRLVGITALYGEAILQKSKQETA